MPLVSRRTLTAFPATSLLPYPAGAPAVAAERSVGEGPPPTVIDEPSSTSRAAVTLA